MKNSEQRTGFGFKTAIRAGMLRALVSFPKSGDSAITKSGIYGYFAMVT